QRQPGQTLAGGFQVEVAHGRAAWVGKLGALCAAGAGAGATIQGLHITPPP
ncbi:MAG: hypothetical protein RJA10_2277, partial [Pseudomonadota bacterium]